MPIISGGDKVLVSGANGFVGTWIVRKLLEKGYNVRGTVRSLDKGAFLLESFKGHESAFEIAIVPDITKKGAFDEAIKGVHAIVHVASPFYVEITSTNELIEPAVNGTLSILESAADARHIKRVVITSSTTAVESEPGKDKVYSEEDWNEHAIKEIEENGNNTSGIPTYAASKTLAEKAAWEFYRKNKQNLSWDLSVLNPSFIFGPVIHEVKNFNALNTSLRLWYYMVLVDGKSKEELFQGLAWVDVRDVAEAHTLALEKVAAGGERIIISAGPYVWQDWLDAANSLPRDSPNIPSFSKLPIGYPHNKDTSRVVLDLDASKATKIFGLTFCDMKGSAHDMLTEFVRRGW